MRMRIVFRNSAPMIAFALTTLATVLPVRHFVNIWTDSGAHPASCPIGSGGAVLSRLMRPGCGLVHSPPSNAEVKNDGTVPPLPYTS
jgi:hypothetical protein